MRQALIVVEPYGKRLVVRKGVKLLDALLTNGVPVRSDCGGVGACGKCKVIVREGEVSPLTEVELNLLSREEVENGYRLACQVKVLGDVTVYIPEESRVLKRRMQVEGVTREVKLLPAVEKVYIQVKPSSLSDLRADCERVLEKLGKVEVPLSVLRRLPSLLREGGWRVTVTLWKGRKVISVDPGDTRGRVYGVAVDLGTSKIACCLVNLANGEVLARASVENPQLLRGEDVISRISYASQSAGKLEELRKLAVKGVNKVINECLSQARVKPGEVYEVVVVGNTAMHHLFLGVDVKYLGLAPYTPAVKGPLNLRAGDLGLSVNKEANVHLPPVVAGFVGADAVAVTLTTGIAESRELSLAFDIGTNTEVIVGSKDGFYMTSVSYTHLTLPTN